MPDSALPSSGKSGMTTRFLCAFTESSCCTATTIRTCTIGTTDTYECQNCQQTCDPVPHTRNPSSTGSVRPMP
jgi:hypothetical protein